MAEAILAALVFAAIAVWLWQDGDGGADELPAWLRDDHDRN